MATIETSLHASYQADTWTPLEACREIISNALDGQTRYADLGVGKAELSYSSRTKTVTVRNEGVTVPARALLMGTSESRNDDRAIGQFGEGLPMALLVLAREHFPVTIDNGDERWTPSIERSANFGGEPVLTVTTRKLRVDRNAFEVSIGGVDKELWGRVQQLFLHFDPHFDASQVVEEYDGRRVLLQPRYMGKVYNKGVYVTSREDLLFGYDLEGTLNRDRSFMDTESLREDLSIILQRCVRQSESFSHLLLGQLFSDEGCDSIEGSNRYSDLAYNSTFSDRAFAEFVNRFGDDAFPVSSREDEDRARALGLKPVRLGATLTRILSDRTGTIENREAKQKEAPTRVWHQHELTSAELYNFELAWRLMKSVRPDALARIQARVVDFNGDGVKFVADDTTFSLSKKVLLDFTETLMLLTKMTARADGTYADVKIMADIIDCLVRGNGPLDLALMMLARSNN